MAIAQMKKFVIASHRSEASELLEALQRAGIVQILDAERAMVSKEWPELQVKAARPRELEEMVARLEKSIKFLEGHAVEKSPKTLFEPLIPVKAENYTEVVRGEKSGKLLQKAEKTAANIDNLLTERENASGHLNMLLPWAGLTTPVEELGGLETASCLIGLLPTQNIDDIKETLTDFSAIIEIVGEKDGLASCLIICMLDIASQVQKTLRSVDFEPVSFEGLSGTADELIASTRAELASIEEKLAQAKETAAAIASDILKLQMLFDHNYNLLDREQAGANCPATENTVLFEGWVRKRDYKKLEKLVGAYGSSNIGEMEIAEGEEPPVEIDNGPLGEPFEAVTRLYGMPSPKDVDPTAFLAPFFAIFFGICMTDAAYGVIMFLFFAWLLKKIKGDKRFVMMMVFCSITTFVAGALTGGWFGDGITLFVPQLEGFREKLIWFDPMKEPMTFFYLSLGLGYVQIIAGIAIGCIHKFRIGDYASAIGDHLTWFIWLNSLTAFSLCKVEVLPKGLAPVFLVLAIIPALGIILFSEREGGWGGRIGMGIYNVFSTVFYVGDILSYIRLMALGMVTGGFGMAINQIAKQTAEIPKFGWLIAGLIFIGGHLFNIANSALSSFVHSMRLQFVEFFTKFIVGGGTQFEPLQEKYQHVKIEDSK